MRFLVEADIQQFVDQQNYDIRVTGDARWIDQKCTPDVLTNIADCILNYTEKEVFTTVDIWHSDFAVRNIEMIYKKPGLLDKKAENEYDKVFAQPMRLFAMANILTLEKRGNRNFFQVENRDILSYIAMREHNALTFLNLYIEKTLSDSGIFNYFETFFDEQTESAYARLKNLFAEFTIRHTSINRALECNRVFTKVLNPLAYFRNAKGTMWGRLSKEPITYDMLVYNRPNFRDIISEKPKGLTRKEYLATRAEEIEDIRSDYLSQKAKRYLKDFNYEFRNGQTEHLDGRHDDDEATHIHHVFPEHEFPELYDYLENLMALTPTQHLNYAHPRGRTQEIDEDYQHKLLLAKVERIKENLENDEQETIYDFERFKYVLEVGFNNEAIAEIENGDFAALIEKINAYYEELKMKWDSN